jgi:2-polyprenyl-6-methoxyphenol hydroxylase-like FAD-dependent oxidoreductase
VLIFSTGPGAWIETVEESDQGVTVTTADGRMFTGDMLVGADGIHSVVRREMWRLGRKKDPQSFREDEVDGQ